MSNQDVVKFGNTFYLKHESGQYLVNVDCGRYNWPKLGNTGKVKLELKGGKGEVQSNSRIKIRTTESVTAQNDILGAFADSHDCYYWQNSDEDKQSWQITKASGEAGPICYGDRVYLTNCSYTTQKLSADTSNLGYITTAENVNDSWILQSTVEHSVTQSLRVLNWSVASGDPTASGVILWTRVNPEAFDKTTPLKYQVARDQNFQSIVLENQENASEFGVERDYTVHIDLDGKLEANTSYFYRFIYKDISSPIGRCKTLPAADAELSKLRLAVLTCNDYSTGYFNAFYELAKEDVDFVIHLGDFAYEYPQYPPGYGEIIRTDLQLKEEPGQYEPKGKSGGKRATTLGNFRHIYRTYREDPALQAAMEKHTWIVILDDHEIADNAYWDYEHNTLGAHPSHAIYEHYFYYGPEDEDFDKKKKDYYEGYEGDRAKLSLAKLKKKQQECRQEMRRLYEEAIQAWKEYVPARVTQDVPYEVEVNGKKEKHWRYKLYRNFRFGKLVDFYLTDSRSSRDKAEWDKNKAIFNKATELKAKQPEISAAEHIASARKSNNAEKTPPDWKWSMLGPEQKQWLINGIKNSDASWRVWGNQTLLATSSLAGLEGIDDWYGFMAERYEILKTIKEAETKRQSDKVSRFVVFTGDMHTSLIAYLKADFAGYGNWDYSQLVGVEFMTPSLTSPGIIDGARSKAPIKLLSELLGGVVSAATQAGINSYIKHFNSDINGYAIAEFTPDELKWSVYQINKIAYDKVDDGHGSNVRNVSTNSVQKQPVHSATYQPNGIQLG